MLTDMQTSQSNGSTNTHNPVLLSRNGSGAGLPPNVPTGPANRTKGAASAEAHNPSTEPSNTIVADRVPSTPAQTAPPVPSMLPKSTGLDNGLANNSPLPQLESTASPCTPSARFAALRQLKNNKLATPTVHKLQQTQVDAQNTELAQLKKNHNDLLQKFKELESLVNVALISRIKAVENKQETNSADMSRLDPKLADTNESVEKLQKSCESCTKKVTELGQKLNDVKEQTDTNTASLKKMHSDTKIPELEQKLVHLDAQAKSTAENLKKIPDLEQKLDDLIKQAVNNPVSYEKLEKSVVDHTKQINESKKTIQNLKADVGSLRENLDKIPILEEDIEQVKGRTNINTAATEEVKKLIGSSSTESTARCKTIFNRLQQHDDQIGSLSKQEITFQGKLESMKKEGTQNLARFTQMEKKLLESSAAQTETSSSNATEPQLLIQQQGQFLQQLEAQIHDLRIDVDVAKEVSADYFTEQFDPFKQIATARFDAADKALEDRVKPLEDRLQHMRHTVSNLNDKFNNITTEELYRNIMTWFLQSEPPTSADLIQNIHVLQQQVGDLQDARETKVETDQTAAVEIATKIAEEAKEVAKEAKEFAKEAKDTVNEAKEIAKEVKEKVSSMGEEITKKSTADKKHNTRISKFASEAASQIKDMQKNTDQKSKDMATQIKSLEDSVSQIQQDCLKLGENVTSIETWRQDQTTDITSLNKSIEKCGKQHENPSNAIQAINTEIHELRENYEKEHKQLQQQNSDLVDFVGDLNMNLPKGPLRFPFKKTARSRKR